ASLSLQMRPPPTNGNRPMPKRWTCGTVDVSKFGGNLRAGNAAELSSTDFNRGRPRPLTWPSAHVPSTGLRLVFTYKRGSQFEPCCADCLSSDLWPGQGLSDRFLSNCVTRRRRSDVSDRS